MYFLNVLHSILMVNRTSGYSIVVLYRFVARCPAVFPAQVEGLAGRVVPPGALPATLLGTQLQGTGCCQGGKTLEVKDQHLLSCGPKHRLRGQGSRKTNRDNDRHVHSEFDVTCHSSILSLFEFHLGCDPVQHTFLCNTSLG